MLFLVIGITLFIGMHLVPCFSGLRQNLTDSLGEKKYLGLFSVVSLVGLVLMIYGKSQAGFQAVYEPLPWGRNVAGPLVLLAFILLAAAHMKTNIKRFTRHPMLWGFVCWSAAHLLSNGDLGSIVMFGAFATYSLLAMFLLNMRGTAKQDVKYPLSKDAVVIVGGLVVYAVFLLLHPYLFGVAVI